MEVGHTHAEDANVALWGAIDGRATMYTTLAEMLRHRVFKFYWEIIRGKTIHESRKEPSLARDLAFYKANSHAWPH